MRFNFSIRNRLIFILVCWMIVLACFGFFTRIKMNELAIATYEMNDGPLTVSNSAKEVIINILKIQRGVKDVLLSFDEGEIANELDMNNGYEKIVYDNLEIIKIHTRLDYTRQLEAKTRVLFLEWRELHKEMVELTYQNKRDEAIALTKTISSEIASKLEANLVTIDKLAVSKAGEYVALSEEIEKNLRDTMIYLLIGVAILFSLLFILIIKSIVGPIATLTTAMDNSTITGKLSEVALRGKDEISEIANYYNSLVNKLLNQFWIKDGQNYLNQELSGINNIEDLTQRSINFLARTLEAGKGVFYLYNKEGKELSLTASFAFTEREHILNKYKLGEGIIGQVALERMPILLKNINRKDSYISTGLVIETPTNIIAFPLIFENELYGVIELAFLEPLDEIKKELIKEASKIISINLYSAIQSQRISRLLEKAEAAEGEIRQKASELQITNGILEEQQKLLQQQTEELQQTNTELEEQQQLLQQQSEELQNSNTHMEEQQQVLQNQSSLLAIKNQELEKSKIELMSYSKQLESASKYKSEFLANMSHELRTPLNSIILLSRLLMKNNTDKYDEIELEKLEVIYNSGNELLRLINEILDLSKIEAGKMELNLTEFHTQDLFKELYQLFKGLAEEKNIDFYIEDSISTLLIGDYDKLSQILRNLISNAIKFTEKGSVKLMAGLDKNDRVKFTVIDTGIGITQDNLASIFEEFQQGDGSISRRFGGTGLGLSISKKLADLMKAEISVRSTIDEGSSFELCLNYSIEALNPEGTGISECAISAPETLEDLDIPSRKVKSNENLYLTSKTNMAYSLRLNGKRILIVDDDTRNVFVLASSLENYGAEIIDADNGEVALARLMEVPVDLVLIDIMMPVKDGCETIKEIRSNKKLKDIPIIAITAKSLKGDREKCIAAGADDYISKPVDYDTLIHLVKAWIEKR